MLLAASQTSASVIFNYINIYRSNLSLSKFDFSWHSLDKQMHTSLLQFVQAAGWCRQHHGYFRILHELPRWANLPGWGSFTLLRVQSSQCNVKALQGQKWCALVSNDWQSTQRKLECCNLRRLWLLGVSSATGSFSEFL